VLFLCLCACVLYVLGDIMMVSKRERTNENHGDFKMKDDAKDIIFKLESLGYDHSEAVSELQIMRDLVEDGSSPLELLEDIGLEGDYIFELMPVL